MNIDFCGVKEKILYCTHKHWLCAIDFMHVLSMIDWDVCFIIDWDTLISVVDSNSYMDE